MEKHLRERLQQPQFRNSLETAFVGLLVVAERLNTRLDELCGAHGITHTQYNVLRILRGAPAGHPRFEIANRLIRRAPDVTRLLDRLEREDLIERGWAKENRRHSVARITAKGLRVLEAIDPALMQFQAEVLAPLSPEELRTLGKALDKLVS